MAETRPWKTNFDLAPAEKSNKDTFSVINLESNVPLALARIKGQCHDYALRDVLNLDIVLEDPS